MTPTEVTPAEGLSLLSVAEGLTYPRHMGKPHIRDRKFPPQRSPIVVGQMHKTARDNQSPEPYINLPALLQHLGTRTLISPQLGCVVLLQNAQSCCNSSYRYDRAKQIAARTGCAAISHCLPEVFKAGRSHRIM